MYMTLFLLSFVWVLPLLGFFLFVFWGGVGGGFLKKEASSKPPPHFTPTNLFAFFFKKKRKRTKNPHQALLSVPKPFHRRASLSVRSHAVFVAT